MASSKELPMRLDRSRNRTAAMSRAAALAVVLAVPFGGPLTAQSIAEYTGGMDSQEGFIPLHWDGETGRLLLEIDRLDEEFLYLQSLATGIGSNRLGLDRGMIGSEHIAKFERVGPKVHFVLQNPAFRAEEGWTDALERSVDESFATSTVASWNIVAEDGGAVLVDATAFFFEDVMGIADRLRQSGQGTFRVDVERSRVHLPRTKAFPENTEVEATLTFAGTDPGPEIRRHTPDGRSLSLREHHSFVRLPDDDFRPRAFDPRIGLFAVSYFDFGRSFDTDYVTRWAMRHRLQKRDPGAQMSEPIEPIIYYLDPAVPEPYRSAFEVGGVWWNQVFEAAGFIDAFQIHDMPADMDPMDARYHVIQWVHRTEAGSSIGPSFVDPRTGEIIKAAVRMDSHRSLADSACDGGSRSFRRGRRRPRRHRDIPGRGWLSRLDRAAGSRRDGRGVHDGPTASALGARDRPYARLGPQLHRGQLRARFGHGLPRAADRAGGRSGTACRCVPSGPGCLRHARDPMGVLGVRVR
jgi:hypothetical protein